jgi:hypothetical protein
MASAYVSGSSKSAQDGLVAGSRAASVLAGRLDVADAKHVDRAAAGLQPESELLLEGNRDRRTEIGGRWCRRRGDKKYWTRSVSLRLRVGLQMQLAAQPCSAAIGAGRPLHFDYTISRFVRV